MKLPSESYLLHSLYLLLKNVLVEKVGSFVLKPFFKGTFSYPKEKPNLILQLILGIKQL